MTTVTIGDLCTDAMPETERLLLADVNMDYANAKIRAIALAKAQVYGSEVAESTITNLEVRRYLSFLALRDSLIATAIDWCQHKTRLSDAKDGATISYPDQVAALQDKLTQVRLWIRENEGRIQSIVLEDSSSGDDAQIDVSILDAGTRAAKYKASPDPWVMAQYR